MKAINIITAFLAFSAPAFPSIEDKSVELMEVMDVRQTITSSMDRLIQLSEKMIENQNLEPAIESAAKSANRKSIVASIEAMEEIDWESIFAGIYASVYTEDEIQGLIDFYRSPIGRKMLEKQPEVMTATMSRMQTEIARIMPKIQAAAVQAVQEAKAEHANR